jgi:hypothetical protein
MDLFVSSNFAAAGDSTVGSQEHNSTLVLSCGNWIGVLCLFLCFRRPSPPKALTEGRGTNENTNLLLKAVLPSEPVPFIRDLSHKFRFPTAGETGS